MQPAGDDRGGGGLKGGRGGLPTSHPTNGIVVREAQPAELVAAAPSLPVTCHVIASRPSCMPFFLKKKTQITLYTQICVCTNVCIHMYTYK
jgi:hypothetical protein